MIKEIEALLILDQMLLTKGDVCEEFWLPGHEEGPDQDQDQGGYAARIADLRGSRATGDERRNVMLAEHFA